MKNFTDRRNMLNIKAIDYLMDKYRDQMAKSENEHRRAIKVLVCHRCGSFNGCDQCKHWR